MPLIKLETSVECAGQKKNEIATKLSILCAEGLGKPESVVQAVVSDNLTFTFAGKPDARSAFVELRSIGGLSPDVNKQLSSDICALLERELNIPPAGIYINFIDIPRANWGHDNKTFA